MLDVCALLQKQLGACLRRRNRTALEEPGARAVLHWEFFLVFQAPGHQWDPKVAANRPQGRPVGFLLLQERWEGGAAAWKTLGPASEALLWFCLTVRLLSYWQSKHNDTMREAKAQIGWATRSHTGPVDYRLGGPHPSLSVSTTLTRSNLPSSGTTYTLF